MSTTFKAWACEHCGKSVLMLNLTDGTAIALDPETEERYVRHGPRGETAIVTDTHTSHALTCSGQKHDTVRCSICTAQGDVGPGQPLPKDWTESHDRAPLCGRCSR